MGITFHVRLLLARKAVLEFRENAHRHPGTPQGLGTLEGLGKKREAQTHSPCSSWAGPLADTLLRNDQLRRESKPQSVRFDNPGFTGEAKQNYRRAIVNNAKTARNFKSFPVVFARHSKKLSENSRAAVNPHSRASAGKRHHRKMANSLLRWDRTHGCRAQISPGDSWRR